MRLLVLLFLAFHAVSASAQKWYPYKDQQDKTAWMTLDGKLTIPPSSITDIKHDNWLVTTKTGKKGAIDPNGKLVIDTNYHSLEKLNDSLVIFSLVEKKGSDDTLVKLQSTGYEHRLRIPDNRFGLIDLHGKILLEPVYSRFSLTKHNSKKEYLVVYEKMMPLENHFKAVDRRGREVALVGLLSLGGKIITPTIFASFYRQSESLYAAILPFDNQYFQDAYLIEQPDVKWKSGCEVGSYKTPAKPAMNYYSNIILYNNSLQEVNHFRGSPPAEGSRVIDGTQKAYYFYKDRMIDSVEIVRIYDSYSQNPRTIWKNDPCGYAAEEYLPVSHSRFRAVEKNAFAPLYSVFSERGHCLLDADMDTVLFSAENHFFKYPNTSEIHIRTCDGKWGLADMSGKELVPTISDSMIFHVKSFTKIWQGGKAVWLDKHLKPIDIEGMEVVLAPQFPKREGESAYYSSFIYVHSLQTGKYGLADTSGKLVIPAEYDEIHSKQYGFLVRKGKKTGLIEYDGLVFQPVTYKKQLVSNSVKLNFETRSNEWIPDSPNRQFLIMTKKNKQGIISINKKVALHARYNRVRLLGGEIFSVKKNAKDTTFRLYNAALKKFVSKPFPANDVDADVEQEDSTMTIVITNEATGEIGVMKTNGTWIYKPSLRHINTKYGSFRIVRQEGGRALLDESDKVVLKTDGYMPSYGGRFFHVTSIHSDSNFFYDLADRQFYPTDCIDISEEFEEYGLFVGQTLNGYNLYDTNYRKVLAEDFERFDKGGSYQVLKFYKNGKSFAYSLKTGAMSKPYDFIIKGIAKNGNRYDVLSADGEIMLEDCDKFGEGTNHYWFRKGKTVYWTTKSLDLYKVVEEK